MEDAKSENAIAILRASLDLKIEEFANRLGCSKGHASDLCTGRRAVTQRIAVRLAELSGRPWHEWMPTDEPSRNAA